MEYAVCMGRLVAIGAGEEELDDTAGCDEASGALLLGGATMYSLIRATPASSSLFVFASTLR